MNTVFITSTKTGNMKVYANNETKLQSQNTIDFFENENSRKTASFCKTYTGSFNYIYSFSTLNNWSTTNRFLISEKNPVY